MGLPSRRATDQAGMPLRDRIRWRLSRARELTCAAVRAGGPLLRLVWGTAVIVLAVWAIVDVQDTESTSSERDAARAYQRCEQIVPPTEVVSIALDLVPRLAAAVEQRRPGLLGRDSRGRLHLEVPDCRRIYPRGAAVSHKYPDLTPTKPAP